MTLPNSLAASPADAAAAAPGPARGFAPYPRLVPGILAVVLMSSLSITAGAQGLREECGEFANGNLGPFDYRVATPEIKRRVETYHFTPKVERLEAGQSGASIGSDLSFTLRYFPNHRRALASMVRYGLKTRAEKPPGSQYTVSCWIERAIEYQPDDAAMYPIRGYYLFKKGDSKGAARDFRRAIELGLDDGNTHYNLGLALVEQGEYAEAVKEAKIAAKLGFTLPGLKRRLVELGKWQD